MKYQFIALLGFTVATTVSAASDAGIYGRLDVAQMAAPQVLNAKPMLAESASKRAATVKAIYVHLPPGDEKHWRAHCRIYDACGVPVHFVTESWFRTVYLPSIGAQDGREQRYREQAHRQGRGNERDTRDIHPE